MPANIRRSPTQLWSVMLRVFPLPPTIRIMPMNESVTLPQIFCSTFSTARIELRVATNMGMVAYNREELPAVVR